MAFGVNGSVLTSTDGVKWFLIKIGGNNYFYSVAWTGNLLVAVSTAGGIFTSPQDPPLTIPDTPTLSTPIQNGAGVATPTNLSWSPSAGATSYRVQLSTDSTFATSLINDSTLTTNSRSTGTLSSGTTFYWKVNAKNAAGTSGFSSTWNFTTRTLSIPSTPNLNSPAQNATDVTTNPIMNWSASAGATSYHVQVSNNSGFTTLVVDDSTPTGTSLSVGPLANSTVYYWRVNAKNAAGTSAYSAIQNFSTTILVAPAFPVLTSPALNASLVLNTTLTWSTVQGAATYRLQISTNSGFTTLSVDDSTITTASIFKPLAAWTSYYWRVNAKNAVGTSAYSAIWSFTTGGGDAISPRQFISNHLRFENGEILRFDLPNSMIGSHSRAVIYSLTGNKMVEVHSKGSATEMTLPLNNLSRGVYLLELRGAGKRITESFGLTR